MLVLVALAASLGSAAGTHLSLLINKLVVLESQRKGGSAYHVRCTYAKPLDTYVSQQVGGGT